MTFETQFKTSYLLLIHTCEGEALKTLEPLFIEVSELHDNGQFEDAHDKLNILAKALIKLLEA